MCLPLAAGAGVGVATQVVGLVISAVGTAASIAQGQQQAAFAQQQANLQLQQQRQQAQIANQKTANQYTGEVAAQQAKNMAYQNQLISSITKLLPINHSLRSKQSSMKREIRQHSKHKKSMQSLLALRARFWQLELLVRALVYSLLMLIVRLAWGLLRKMLPFVALHSRPLSVLIWRLLKLIQQITKRIAL